MTEAAALRVRDLHKSFSTGDETVQVLDGVSFELQKGEAVAITGPSGSGKSTLLHLLGALDTPTSGTIEIDGASAFDLEEKDLARFRNKTLGFIFQEHHLLPQYTVLENVLLPTLAFPPAPETAEATALELLERVGLSHRLGFGDAYTEGRDEMDWLRHIYDVARQQAAEQKLELPDFDVFWETGHYEFPRPTRPVVLLEDFRDDPEAKPLKTASGRIEIYCETIAGYGYDDCPGHAVWLEPAE